MLKVIQRSVLSFDLFSMCPVLIESNGTGMWFVLSSYRILDGNKIKLTKESFENFSNLESL